MKMPAIEFVGRCEKIVAFLPIIDGLVKEGLVALEKIGVIWYRAGDKREEQS